jgi:hypothetical protein
MTPGQEKAVARFRNFLQKQADDGKKYGGQITKFDVHPLSEGSNVLWIAAEVELMGLPTTNLLRYLDHEYWTAMVGKRGGITVNGSPKSFKQFHGRMAFGMKFDFYELRRDYKARQAARKAEANQ